MMLMAYIIVLAAVSVVLLILFSCIIVLFELISDLVSTRRCRIKHN